ncbi:MAG: glucose 1-dehydrogenase [Alphaproteobacteria bacterium]
MTEASARAGQLDGAVALVTGSGAGLGRSYAIMLAARGAAVIVHDINAETAEDTASAIRKAGQRAWAIVNDITNVTQFKEMAGSIEREAGSIDVLVNNAGIDEGKLLEEISEASFDRMFAVHVKGTFFATQAIVPGMKRRKRGSIINISSINGMIADSTDSHYNGAKAAILGLTKAWARELAPWGIRVNAVAPGHIVTAQTIARGQERMKRIIAERIPLKRYGEPDEVAHTVAFLASEESAFITGQVLSPNGGEAIVGI